MWGRVTAPWSGETPRSPSSAPPLLGGEPEAQRGGETCPKLHSSLRLSRAPGAGQLPSSGQGPKANTETEPGESLLRIKAKAARRNEGQLKAEGGGASHRDLGTNSSDCPAP